jgi:hypothetical protein
VGNFEVISDGFNIDAIFRPCVNDFLPKKNYYNSSSSSNNNNNNSGDKKSSYFYSCKQSETRTGYSPMTVCVRNINSTI